MKNPRCHHLNHRRPSCVSQYASATNPTCSSSETCQQCVLTWKQALLLNLDDEYSHETCHHWMKNCWLSWPSKPTLLVVKERKRKSQSWDLHRIESRTECPFESRKCGRHQKEGVAWPCGFCSDGVLMHWCFYRHLDTRRS